MRSPTRAKTRTHQWSTTRITRPDPNCEVNNWIWTKKQQPKPPPSNKNLYYRLPPCSSLRLLMVSVYNSHYSGTENKTEKSKQTSISALSTPRASWVDGSALVTKNVWFFSVLFLHSKNVNSLDGEGGRLVGWRF